LITIKKIFYLIFILIITFLVFSEKCFSQIDYEYDTILNQKILNPGLKPSNSCFSIFDFIGQDQKSSLKYLLPIQFHFRNNFNRPFGENDGEFIQTAGAQFVFKAPLFLMSKYIDLVVDPTYQSLANASYKKSDDWGTFYNEKQHFLKLRSSVRFKWKELALELSNHNYVQGSTNINHLLMSKNAPGFNHVKIGTMQPVKLGFAHWELQLISGLLKSSRKEFPLENYNLQNSIYINSDLDRYFSGLLFSISPIFLKNNTFGILRQFQLPENEFPRVKGFYNKYLPVLGEATKKSVGGLNEDKINRDQQLIFFYKLHVPVVKSTLSIEYGWNDHKWDMRDLLTSWPHSLSYIVSYKKLFPRKQGYNDLVIEYVNMKQPLEYAVRNAGDWYVHGNGEGFTNQGQILGVGGSNGIGLNKLNLLFRVNNAKSVNSIRVSQIKNDHSYYGQTVWNDWIFSLARSQKIENSSLRTELSFIRSLNYAFLSNKNLNAFQINISYIYNLRK